jgi:hypothetical protein
MSHKIANSKTLDVVPNSGPKLRLSFDSTRVIDTAHTVGIFEMAVRLSFGAFPAGVPDH